MTSSLRHTKTVEKSWVEPPILENYNIYPSFWYPIQLIWLTFTICHFSFENLWYGNSAISRSRDFKVRGHRRSLKMAKMESPYMVSIQLIIQFTCLSMTVSKLFRVKGRSIALICSPLKFLLESLIDSITLKKMIHFPDILLTSFDPKQMPKEIKILEYCFFITICISNQIYNLGNVTVTNSFLQCLGSIVP